MDSNKEIKKFNIKLLVVFFAMIAIFVTLLVVRVQAMFDATEIASEKWLDLPEKEDGTPAPVYFNEDDLDYYYDILCCQHGTPLNTGAKVHLTGNDSQGSFDYDMGKWEELGYQKDSILRNHSISANYSKPKYDFDKSVYTHRTYGYYDNIESHIATPKEAYIIAEMKKEMADSQSSIEVVRENGQPKVYTGGFVDEYYSYRVSSGEQVYTVNQKYVVDTGNGVFYVNPAVDENGERYYIFQNDGGNGAKAYTGELVWTDSRTGETEDLHPTRAKDFYWERNGEISPAEVPEEGWDLYLLDYDTVTEIDGSFYYVYVESDYSYIQMAWWTTQMGTSNWTVQAVAGNDLSKEAEAFEEYILNLAGVSSTDELEYEMQSYDFIEEDGTHSVGEIEAPVINYKPDFNREDADQNGVVNEADEVTVSFDPEKNAYIIGPYSINYIKESVNIEGRESIDFAGITGVKLNTNVGELELGKDWNFLFLTDQARDLEEGYPYPNPNEQFYLQINYIEGFTVIKEFKFSFRYMNAGARLDIYDGFYKQVTWEVDGDKEANGDSRNVWLRCTSVEPKDSQTLAHALRGARWFVETDCVTSYGIHKAKIKVEKETVAGKDDGAEIPLDKTFYFKIFINGEEYQHLSVSTKNGYGSSLSNLITWNDDEEAPTFEVVELGDYQNDGPWSGQLQEGINEENIVHVKNNLEPHEGNLRIDKMLLNATPALEGETFSFTVTLTGTFVYGNEGLKTYTSDDPFKLDVSITGEGEWTSDSFRWYDAPPKYKVEENIVDGATYELVNGVVTNGNNYLEDGATLVAIATNQPLATRTIIEVDKRMVSSTKPEPGEVFKAHLTIKGEFSYDGDEIQERTFEEDITLDESNNWDWKSAEIVWRDGAIPEYTISETEMADGTKFVSVSDEHKSGLVNDFSSKLNEELTHVIITNDKKQTNVGRLKILKLVETEDLYGMTFNFEVNVTGTFEYNGTKYEDTTLTIPVEITPIQDDEGSYEWKSDIFSWDEDVDAPSYSVEEVNLPEGAKFVSISNENSTTTSSQKIEGQLIGKILNTNLSDSSESTDSDEPSDSEDKVGQEVVVCTNTGIARRQAHIVIIKESIDEAIDDYVFFFKVTITGTFKYNGEQYTNDTLVLDGKIDDVEAVCGGEDWVSELIGWDEGAPAPTYTVEEISIPANMEFVSISNRVKTSTSTKIDGTLAEGAENNYVVAINKPGEDFVDGSIRIVKKTSEDLKGKIFKFNLKITGEFDYGGKSYGADSPNGNTYTLEGIEVEGNGNPWVSGVVTWDQSGTPPTYEVTEVELPEGSHFVSISNETEISTDAGSKTITGTLSLTKPAKIVAINYGENLPKASHIEITKEVLNENLKGTNFYFNVKVWSSEPFRYHDLEDPSKVTVYTPGEDALEFNNVIVVADEKDWVSGYFEWDGDVVPQYEISEITGAFLDNVKSVSIRNDTNIVVKELTNGSREDLVITGNLVGDITHIIAVNDADEKTPVKGKIVIEKKALNEKLDGKEYTFSLKITGKFKYNGQEYKELTINDIKVTANGETWSSDDIEWYEEDGAPKYTITENTDEFKNGETFVSIRNAYQSSIQPSISGTVETHDNNWVLVENTCSGYDKGRIQIHKTLLDDNGNEIEGVNFKFKVTISSNGETIDEQEVTVTSGEYWRSNWYTWAKGDPVPTYHVEEIDNDGYSVNIQNADGELEAQDSENGISGIVDVVAQNNYAGVHKAQLRVTKDLIFNDKMAENDLTDSFTFLVSISGTFTYKNVPYNDESLTLRVVVTKDTDWTWLSDVICWTGDEAPIFIVEEPETNMPAGWHLVSTKSPSEDNRLVDGSESEVTVTNEWRYDEELVVTMKLGGKVWDDTNRTSDKHIDSLENGRIDENEPGIENVKVTIYRALVDKSSGKVVRRLEGINVYDESDLTTPLENVTYTDNNGNWSFGAVSVPALTEEEKQTYGDNYAVTYDVEFEYDGQTYEPTEFLATSEEPKSFVGADSTNNMYTDISNRATAFKTSSTSERDNYLLTSMAIDDEDERKEFNNGFADIQGKEVMDDKGNTVGATGSGKELNYTSVDSVSFFNSDNSRKVSTLETVNKDGEIFDSLKMKASTSNADLTFPFYTEDPAYDTTAWHLRSWDKAITDALKITYKFEAVYNYCLSINLGLVEREATDVALEKDLTEALVVVNGKALKYKFNRAIDLEDPDNTELLYKQLSVEDSQIEYNLGLYSGDYYYRAEVYNSNSEVQGALDGFYRTKLGFSEGVQASELEIYLKYTINVYNQSESYDVTIGEVADYYDNSFTLVEATESRYVQTLNGKELNNVMEVAAPSTVKFLKGTDENGDGNVVWAKADTITGSDGVEYGKLTTTSLSGHTLSSGEKASISVTFKIAKGDAPDSGVLNAIKLGKKHNVAEITKFTSYYSSTSENRWSSPGEISGRVDEDSAPGNVNIKDYNEKSYYEDDTDSAPIINVGISDENRVISGIVWDDAQTKDAGYGQIVGNGLYNSDEGDKLINDITTEIYQSITIPETTADGETVYKEYQFAWPTSESIASLGNKTIEELTGFKQSTVTKNGEYEFVNIPAGNYRVRFIYGDKKIETGKSGSEEIYSGQDYKTTAYQIGFDNDRDNDGYVDNDWHDVSNNELNDLRVNDARDDEARRIYISSKSEMLKYDNTSLLAKADDKSKEDSEYSDLFGNYQDVKSTDPVKGEGYYMYAETAKINLGVEDIYKIDYTTETINNIDLGVVDGKAVQNGRTAGTSRFVYNIKNIDCGIEERSQTKITLDKQIKEIRLMTSDNRTILDAIYDITYTLKSDGSISSTVILNKEKSTAPDHIASLNRGNSQGYRYVIVDSQILQGAQIQVVYQITAFNMSETDRISKKLETLWSDINTADSDVEKQNLLDNAIKSVSSNLYTENKGRVDGTEYNSIGYGTYFGSVYYLGSQGVGLRPDEVIVTTKVHQMIDYVDPDVEFSNINNATRDQNWTNTEINYLLDNGLIDPNIVQILDEDGKVTGRTGTDISNSGERQSIISDKLQEYRTETKNNLILAINDGENTETGNPGFIKYLEPYMANSSVDRATGSIALTVSRFYSSETDANDIDNLAEILQFENTAGRRDARNIAGNTNPYELDDGGEPVGIYSAATAGKEKDASATEVITLSPPTGLSPEESRTMQLIIVILVSITIIAVSIVIIKKKVLVQK